MSKHKKPDDREPDADPFEAAPRAADGMPAGEGNRDDAAEFDLGVRTPDMGEPPAAGKSDADKPETDAEKMTRLERELAEARAGLDALVPAAAQSAMGLDPAAKAKKVKAAAAKAKETELPGTGPVVWEGSLAGDALFKPMKFRGPENEAEAREAYQRAAGIKSTTGKVVVTRVK